MPRFAIYKNNWWVAETSSDILLMQIVALLEGEGYSVKTKTLARGEVAPNWYNFRIRNMKG